MLQLISVLTFLVDTEGLEGKMSEKIQDYNYHLTNEEPLKKRWYDKQVKHARDLCTTSYFIIKLLSFMVLVSMVFNDFQGT